MLLKGERKMLREETKLILQFNKKDGRPYYQIVNRVYNNGEVTWDFMGFLSVKELLRAYDMLKFNEKGDIINEK